MVGVCLSARYCVSVRTLGTSFIFIFFFEGKKYNNTEVSEMSEKIK